jgi:hypothetical protein
VASRMRAKEVSFVLCPPVIASNRLDPAYKAEFAVNIPAQKRHHFYVCEFLFSIEILKY